MKEDPRLKYHLDTEAIPDLVADALRLLRAHKAEFAKEWKGSGDADDMEHIYNMASEPIMVSGKEGVVHKNVLAKDDRYGVPRVVEGLLGTFDPDDDIISVALDAPYVKRHGELFRPKNLVSTHVHEGQHRIYHATPHAIQAGVTDPYHATAANVLGMKTHSGDWNYANDYNEMQANAKTLGYMLRKEKQKKPATVDEMRYALRRMEWYVPGMQANIKSVVDDATMGRTAKESVLVHLLNLVQEAYETGEHDVSDEDLKNINTALIRRQPVETVSKRLVDGVRRAC